MNITEQTLLDLEQSINILIQQKDKLVLDKRENELKASIIKSKIRTGGKMDNTQYLKLNNEQNIIKTDVLSIERAISEVSTEIMKKNTLKEQLRVEFKKQKSVDVKQKITELRDYYINFASDKSRVASMRSMGAEFAEKLEVLIKSI